MEGQPGKVCSFHFIIKTRPRNLGNCREQSCNPHAHAFPGQLLLYLDAFPSSSS